MGLLQRLQTRQSQHNAQQRILNMARKIGVRSSANPAYAGLAQLLSWGQGGGA